MKTATLDLMIAPTVDLSDSGARELVQRVAKWQQLFSPGSARYSLTRYEDLFDAGGDALLIYDNYATTETRWTGFDSYRRVWEREINDNFPGLVLYRVELDRAETRGDLGWTAFTWYGRVERSGVATWPAQHATHIWRRQHGTWQIVHEHLTSGVQAEGRATGERTGAPYGPAAELVRHSRADRRAA